MSTRDDLPPIGKYAMAEVWIHPWTGAVHYGFRDLVHIKQEAALTVETPDGDKSELFGRWMEVTPILGGGFRKCLAPVCRVKPLTRAELKENANRQWYLHGHPCGRMPGPEEFWFEPESGSEGGA